MSQYESTLIADDSREAVLWGLLALVLLLVFSVAIGAFGGYALPWPIGELWGWAIGAWTIYLLYKWKIVVVDP